jgi:hypothetical protein
MSVSIMHGKKQTRVRLATGWAAKKQRHLAIGDRLLTQIVINDEGMLAVVPEEFAHGCPGVGGQKLQRSSIRCCGRNDDGVSGRVIIDMEKLILMNFIASVSVSRFTICATVERFWPMAT